MPPKKDTRNLPSPDLPVMTATAVVAREYAGQRRQRPKRNDRNRAVDDRPDRYEAILLGPGEKKIDVEVDTRMPNAAIFTFHKEDSTLANMLNCRLLKHRNVTFSGYKMPHPLVNNFELRVQTDGEITPRAAVIASCNSLIKELGIISREFTKEYELRKMANAANQQQTE